MIERPDQVWRDLERAVMVEPSAGFTARVGRAASAARVPAWRRAVRWGLPAAAGAGLAVALAAVWPAPDRVAPPGVARISAVPPAAGPLAVPNGAPAAGPGTVAPAVARGPAPGSRTPDLIVITDQGRVLQRLWARALGGYVVEADPDPTAPPRPIVGPLEIAPLVVDPIVVPSVASDMRSSGGGSPEIRRVAAAEAAGSSL